MKLKSRWLLFVGLLASCTAPGQEMEPVAVEEPKSEMARSELPPGFDVQGHRGARGLKPENTLPAFEVALDLGVNTLELDLHLTADNKVVIWHDDGITSEKCWLDPKAGTDLPDPDSLIKWGDALMISQLTLDELGAYRCDRNPDPGSFPDQDNTPTRLAGDNYRILSLAALFEFVDAYSQSDLKRDDQRENASQVQFNIETKRKPDKPKAIDDGFDGENPGPFELEILRLVTQYELQERVIIQSFDQRSLRAIHSVNDDIRLAALTTGRNPDVTGYPELGASIWSPRHTDLTPALVSKAHKVGLLVVPWTVNDADTMLEMIEMGVDGIISDRPDILLRSEL